MAEAAAGSAIAARSMQERLQSGFVVADYFPDIADLSENLTPEQFRRDFGGAGSPRYRQTIADIEARIDRCAALAPPDGR
jgi:hypothetical protein